MEAPIRVGIVGADASGQGWAPLSHWPAHRVSICYQISEFGPGLKVLVDLTRELVAHYKLFV